MTPEEKERVLVLRKQGFSFALISHITNLPKSSVARACRNIKKYENCKKDL